MNRAVLLFVAGFWFGCGGTSTRVNTGLPEGRETVRGTLVYEARSPTFSGASQRVERRAARFVVVRGLDRRSRVVATSETDASGAFALRGSSPIALVQFVTRVDHDGYLLSVATDANGTMPHDFEVEVPATGDLDAVARDDAEGGPGGAFHMLDTLLRGEESTRAWLGATLPELYAYWGRGVTTNWSFFEGEVPEGSGRFKLELLGGEPGRRSTTDTDEHDEAVILHELGHFVFDRLSSASSTGGTHPSGHFVDPGLAWEEGRATWLDRKSVV